MHVKVYVGFVPNVCLCADCWGLGLVFMPYMHVGECMHDWERASEIMGCFDGFGHCGS